MGTLQPGTIMDLDSTGIFYSTVATKTHPGNFSVGVYLNEDVKPEILQKAVDRLYARLPHFNVAITHVGNTNKNLVLSEKVLARYDEHPEDFCSYFEEGSVTSRVLYGKDYIIMETLHSVCDGGTLTKALKALVIEYFAQQGIKTPYQEINLDEEPKEDDCLDCGAKFKKEGLPPAEAEEPVKPFRISGTKAKSTKTNYLLPCKQIKEKAKAHGATITEYLIGLMIVEFGKKRDEKGEKGPILISVPLDARRFFNASTLRNFVIAVMISVQSWESFDDLLSQIHAQLTGVTFEQVEAGVTRSELIKAPLPDLAYEQKKALIMSFDEKYAGGSTMTSVISNVGLVRFDPAIQSKIKYMDFTLCPEEHCPYQFACITCGDILTLCVTSGIEETQIVDNLIEKLK